jgi:Family of unknown function (DUF6077)
VTEQPRPAYTRIDQGAASASFTLLFVFCGWTLLHHCATFIGIPWGDLVQWAWFWLPALLLAALLAGQALARRYVTQILTPPVGSPKHGLSEWQLGLGIGLLALAAVVVALCAHRSDFDDAEYLQLAMQTMSHPQLAPHTFDASLGHLLNQIRFSPYRIASYETLVAMAATLGTLPVLEVYYLVLPAVFSAFSVLVAYCFLRWFMLAPYALLGLAIFLALSLAWGETHTAYGNRYLVRLFQGKGLIVAITTPLGVLLGLLLLRCPSPLALFGLMATHIAALGASSSGVVTSIIVTGILFVVALHPNPKRMLQRGLLLGTSLLYTVAIALWLRFASAAGGLTPEIGSLLPITTSLGGVPRLGLSFVILALGCIAAAMPWIFRAGGTKATAPDIVSRREYLLLVAGCLLIALNPFVADFFALISARNMTWRLAWAAPMTLILSLGLLYLFRADVPSATQTGPAVATPVNRLVGQGPKLVSAILFMAFLLAGRWVLAPGNGVQIGWPSPKVPPEYHQAVALNKLLLQYPEGLTGSVLVEPRVGTWLTVVNPGLHLVMPGHGYPVTLGTILPKEEHADRVALLNYISSPPAPSGTASAAIAKDLARFKVTAVIDMQGAQSQLGRIQGPLGSSGYQKLVQTQGANLFFKGTPQ